MQEINLLQSKVKDRTLQYERSNRLVIGFFTILVILELAATGGLYFLAKNTSSQAADVATQNQSIQNAMNQNQSDLAMAKGLQGQLKNVQLLLNNHISWSTFFDQISALTPKKVEYTSLSGSTSDGKIHLEGQGETYNDIGQLILSLSTSGKFSNVQLLSVSPASGTQFGFGFSMDLQTTPALFKKQ